MDANKTSKIGFIRELKNKNICFNPRPFSVKLVDKNENIVVTDNFIQQHLKVAEKVDLLLEKLENNAELIEFETVDNTVLTSQSEINPVTLKK